MEIMQTSPTAIALTVIWIVVGTAIAFHLFEATKSRPDDTKLTFPFALLMGLTVGPVLYVLAVFTAVRVALFGAQEDDE